MNSSELLGYCNPPLPDTSYMDVQAHVRRLHQKLPEAASSLNYPMPLCFYG